MRLCSSRASPLAISAAKPAFGRPLIPESVTSPANRRIDIRLALKGRGHAAALSGGGGGRVFSVHATAVPQQQMTPGKSQQLTPKGNPLPPVVHAKAKPEGRIIVLGDVHGCLDELRVLLDKVQVQPQTDTLVFVGDLVNKGPDSAGVLQLARKLRALSVRGNHDDAALAAYGEHLNGQKVKEKYDWVAELTAEDAAWLRNLPFTLRLRDEVIVVHAGVVPGVKRKRQRLEDMYMMRDVLRSKSGGWKASNVHTAEGAPWAAMWKGPRHAIFGHDAVRQLQLQPYATGLDTGCVYGGKLSACVLPPRSPEATFALLLRTLMRLLRRRRAAPTLTELGGQIVSVESQQGRGHP